MFCNDKKLYSDEFVRNGLYQHWTMNLFPFLGKTKKHKKYTNKYLHSTNINFENPLVANVFKSKFELDLK